MLFSGPYPEPHLLVKTKTKIAVVDLTSVYSTSVIEHLDQSTKFRSWQIDPVERKMYFEDFQKIYQSNFDGSNKQLASDDRENAFISLFALDWIGKHFFYVKSFRMNRIMTSTLNLMKITTVLVANRNVSSLALDSNAG
jgi:hypothetical protein